MGDVFSEYAKNAAEIAALEAKQEQLKPHLIQMMNDRGEEKLDIGVGKFALLKIKKWTYPEEVVELGDRFNVAKTKAQQTGEATYEESDSLRYTSAKL